MLVGTVITSVVALLIGVPVAVAGALYVTELCTPRLRAPLTTLVELLAAVPSVVYGLWGVFVLIPALIRPAGLPRTGTWVAAALLLLYTAAAHAGKALAARPILADRWCFVRPPRRGCCSAWSFSASPR